MEFNPIEQLAQARKDNPALDRAYKRAEREKEMYLDPVVSYFTRLEEEVREMPIAKRFRRDKTPEHAYSVGGGVLNPTLTELSEEEFKRASLLDSIQQIKAQAVLLAGTVEGIILDIEATKID